MLPAPGVQLLCASSYNRADMQYNEGGSPEQKGKMLQFMEREENTGDSLCYRPEEMKRQGEVKYLSLLKNLGGVTNPVMPLYLIPRCLFPPAFVHRRRQGQQHPGMICQHLARI